MKEIESGGDTLGFCTAFLSKCEEHSVRIEELQKAYQAYKRAAKISNKTYTICEKKFSRDFEKEDEYISRTPAQREKIKAIHKANAKIGEVANKARDAVVKTKYELAKAKIKYNRNKTPAAERKFKQAEKNFDKAKKNFMAIIAKYKTTHGLFIGGEKVY